MSEPYVGQIRMFAGNFAPVAHALCDGQILPITQNDALFSLLGTTYGGNGRDTFALPDLRGRLPIHRGQGPGLTNRPLGLKAGVENATVANASQLPSHTHQLQAASGPGQSELPAGRQFATTDPQQPLYRAASPDVEMDASVIQNAGGGQAHANVMPFLCISFIIALFGTYPSRF